MRRDVNEYEVAKVLDIASNNPYHGTQDHMDGQSQAEQGDYTRSLKHANFLVTETNAQTTDWTSAYQYPPYDGQLRLDVYTHLSSGANMVEYWHWHRFHPDRRPIGRASSRMIWSPTAPMPRSRGRRTNSRRSARISSICKIHNDVAILYSVDSANALDFMPFALAVRASMADGRAGCRLQIRRRSTASRAL